MAKRLTKKQKDFADNYLETGNGTQSALAAYDTEDYKTASVIATENLEKPSVIEYLQDKAIVAAETVFTLVQHAENEGVKLSASKDILDRAGFKAVEKHLNVHIEAVPTDRIKQAADLLNEQYRTIH